MNTKYAISLILIPMILTGCERHQFTVNHVQDITSGDIAEVRIIGFTSETMMWGDFDCNTPYKMPSKGYFPHVRQTYDSAPAYIDKRFKKSHLPQGKYPLDMVEYYVRADKLLGIWPTNHLSDGRICTDTFLIRPEKNKLYEFRNFNDQNMCYFELYEINKKTGDATRMKLTNKPDLCHK